MMLGHHHHFKATVNRCLVCGDRASGRHYGVLSCDGCRGFFKRSVRRQLNYRCKLHGGCHVDVNTRNQCQACRFQKCLEVKMKPEAVQHERVNSSSSSARLHSSSSTSARGSTSAWSAAAKWSTSSSPSKTSATSVNFKHNRSNGPSILTTNESQNDKTDGFLSMPTENDNLELAPSVNHCLTSIGSAPTPAAFPLMIDPEVVFSGNCISSASAPSISPITFIHIYHLISNVVDWSLNSPLFQSIDPTDQQFLLESALNRLLLIDLATIPELSSSPYVRYIFETYFTTASTGSEGHSEQSLQVVEAVRFIEALGLDRTQAGHLKMLVLLQSERSFLLRPNLVSSLFSQVQAALYADLKRKLTNNNGSSVATSAGLLALQIGRILLVLSNLRRLRPSHLAPIHGALLRWIRASNGSSNQSATTA